MKFITRFSIIAILLVTPLRLLIAQTVTLSELMPLGTGQFVDYTQNDTAYTGAAPTKSHASYTVVQSGINNFQGASNVSSVLDSLGTGDPTGIHNLHYSFTAAGDIQIFGDSALLADILPTAVTTGNTPPPNRWLDRYKMSLGTGVVYPIDTINTTISSGGQTADVKITLSGKYSGIESISINGTPISNAYRFEQYANIVITDAGFPLGTLNLDESDWLAKGVGIVRTSTPRDSIYVSLASLPVTAGGREKDYTNYGVISSGVTAKPSPQPGISIYPDPATDAVTISLAKPAKQIMLYASDGQMARSFDISGHGTDALLWVSDIPNGYYITRVRYADGTMGSTSIIVKH